jgi:exodeoxyribonuclease VII small subunit
MLGMGHDLFGAGSGEGKMDMAAGGKPPQDPQRKVEKADAKPAPARGGQAAPDAVSGMRFEEAFARLEALVGEMERGELPLETMLDRFEEGVRLVRHCNQFLSQAQLRVERFVEQKDGHWVLKELEKS